MENEKYGIELVADTSQFKQSLKELSQLMQSFSKDIEKQNHTKINWGIFNKDNRITSGQIFEETKRYSQLSRMIEKAQGSVDKYKNKIKELENDMNDLAVQSEKTFEMASQLKELDLKADSGESFTPAEGVLYSQLNREQIEKDEQKIYDTMETNERKMNELIQQRIIAEQQLNALKEKREKESSSGTTQEELEEVKKKYNELKNSANSSHNILDGLFDKSIGKIKRFTFYLLGARSAFSMFMKYQAIYYQYNEKMRYQSELSQNAIALSLAPAFEFLGNVIAYASIAFAKFIELLTGVNVLSKVSTKGIRDYNKGLKESQQLLSGIDEITNLSLPSGTGLADQYKALADFQEKIKEVEKFFRENKWIQSFANGLKSAWEFATKIFDFVFNKHWDVFKYIFGAVAIGTIMLKIGSSITGLSTVLGATTMAGVATGTGLFGLAGLFKFFTTLGLITITLGVVVAEATILADMVKQIKELKQQSHDMRLENLNGWPKVFDVVVDRLNKTKQGTQQWDKDTKNVKESTKSVVNLIKDGKLKYDEYSPAIQHILDSLDKLKDKSQFKTEIEILTSILGKTANDAVLLNYLKTGNVNLNLNASATFGINGTASINNQGSYKIENNSYSAKQSNNNNKKTDTSIVGPSKQTTTSSKDFVGPKQNDINTAKSLINRTLSVFGLKLATGTNYVPYDNFPALLHKGEAVVPAKYNPSVNNATSEYTNNLLETLIVKIDDLAQRPNVFEIDGQKFANATYGLYDNARGRQNYVEGVVR